MKFLSNLWAKIKALGNKIADPIETAVNKFNIELVGDWRKWYKMYSFWFFTLIGMAPDLYNLAVSQGVLAGIATPPDLDRIIKLIAFMGAASRIVKQKQFDSLQQGVTDLQTQKDMVRLENQLEEAKVKQADLDSLQAANQAGEPIAGSTTASNPPSA